MGMAMGTAMGTAMGMAMGFQNVEISGMTKGITGMIATYRNIDFRVICFH